MKHILDRQEFELFKKVFCGRIRVQAGTNWEPFSPLWQKLEAKGYITTYVRDFSDISGTSGTFGYKYRLTKAGEELRDSIRPETDEDREFFEALDKAINKKI